uniref:Uncharacterized protein n=1 Tax=Phlebotomus papatasi TaxID=29031 RepID=A0A1B0DKC7_PHLPP
MATVCAEKTTKRFVGGQFVSFGDREVINTMRDRNITERPITKAEFEELTRKFRSSMVRLKQRNKKLDAVFLIDSSSSVGRRNFMSEVKFVKKLLSDFPVSLNYTRVSVVQFSSQGRIHRHIDQISMPKRDNDKCMLINHEILKLRFIGGGTFTYGALREAHGSSFESFLTLHEPQLRQSAVPPHFWPSLCNKLHNQIFDAGDSLSLLLLDYGEEGRQDDDPVWTVVVSKEGGIEENDGDAIFLVDHAWTFRMDSAKKQLEQMPRLLTRMCVIMGVDQENETQEECVKKVMRKVWRYNSMYSVNATGISIENQMPIWYIMDELGSGIQHSDSPNFRIVPFLHLPDQVTYSVLFPVADCEEDEIVTRDFVEQYSADDEKRRNALLLPWKSTSFLEEEYIQVEPAKDYFLGGRVREESLPDGEIEGPEIDANRPLKVYADYSFVQKYLTDEAFEIVDSPEEADVLWLSSHFKDYKEFSKQNPNKFINQFPYENVLTVKDLLSIVCRRMASQHSNEDTLETYPKWLPTTYNLNTELIQFVSYFQRRQAKSLDNHWICKPWNLARGLDMHITSDIGHIMRLPATGPKIAQKYIENPVLFHRTDLEGAHVKFDVRYVILLKSTNPLCAYIYLVVEIRIVFTCPLAIWHPVDFQQFWLDFIPIPAEDNISCI